MSDQIDKYLWPFYGRAEFVNLRNTLIDTIK